MNVKVIYKEYYGFFPFQLRNPYQSTKYSRVLLGGCRICKMRSFITRTLQIKDSKIGGACSKRVRDAYQVMAGKREGKIHFEDLGVDGKTILEWILGKYCVDWIHLAQDRGQWRAVLKTMTNLLVP
jgi:hypothetical protein